MRSLNLLKTHKLFAGFLALVLVAGMTSPAFAQEWITSPELEIITEPLIPFPPLECEITLNPSINIQLEENEFSEGISKSIQCNIELSNIDFENDCELNRWFSPAGGFGFDSVGFVELFENLGDTSPEHCTVDMELMDVYGQLDTVTQDVWINMDKPIGGTVGSLDTTTLLVAGAQANMGLWSLALVGIVGAGVAITYKLKSKKTEQ